MNKSKVNIANLEYPPDIIYYNYVYWYCLYRNDYAILQGGIEDGEIVSYNEIERIPDIIAIKVLKLIWAMTPQKDEITKHYKYRPPPLGSSVVLDEQPIPNGEKREE